MSSISPASSGKQIDQLTFTRFIAAVTVIYYHYGQGLFPFNYLFFDQLFLVGNVSVSYFYALSGFIMAVVYYREQPGHRFDKMKYWKARFARIYPVYVIALVATVMLLKRQPNGLYKKIFGALMIQSWIPGYPMTYNCPGWSVSVEVFFYLLFPFLIVSFGRVSLKKAVLAVSLFWMSSNLLHVAMSNYLQIKPPSPGYDFLYYLPFLHVNTFLCGVVAGIAYLKHGHVFVERKRLNSTMLLISSGLIFAILLNRTYIEQSLKFTMALTNGLMAPLFLTLIFALACDRTLLSRLFSRRLCLLLGDSSYSMYILHVPIFLAVQQIISVYKLPLSKTSTLHIYVVLVIVLSVFSYLHIEKPARNGLRRLFEADARGCLQRFKKAVSVPDC